MHPLFLIGDASAKERDEELELLVGVDRELLRSLLRRAVQLRRSPPKLRRKGLKARLAEFAGEGRPGEALRPSPEVKVLLFDLMAAVEGERQHSAALWRLLADALQRNFRRLVGGTR